MTEVMVKYQGNAVKRMLISFIVILFQKRLLPQTNFQTVFTAISLFVAQVSC